MAMRNEGGLCGALISKLGSAEFLDGALTDLGRQLYCGRRKRPEPEVADKVYIDIYMRKGGPAFKGSDI